MHLGNGIICPVTGIPMLAIAGVSAIWALKKARKDFKRENIPQAAALTAFVFALQMINFTIPSTGSSGHIIGAVLLAALLGPYAAFLAICAILTVQAVFFADGGLMALGCNIFNMGFLACFVVYPLVYKPLVNNKKYALGAFLSSVAALQLGSIAVVAEAYLSGSISNFANIASISLVVLSTSKIPIICIPLCPPTQEISTPGKIITFPLAASFILSIYSPVLWSVIAIASSPTLWQC